MRRNGFPIGRTISRRKVMMAGGAAAAFAALATPARAVLRLDVTQGNVQPMPIAIPEFIAGTPGEAEMARTVTAVITNNLGHSGLFAPIDPAAYIERIANFDAVPRFPDWRAINAQALLVGRVGRQGDGRLRADFRLWDVLGGQ